MGSAAMAPLGERMPENSARRQQLAGLPLFSGMAPAELDDSAAGSETLVVEEGAVIYRQGSAGDAFYIILSGEVELIARRDDAASGIVGRIGPGGHFGESSLFTGQPRSVTVRAVATVNLLRFSKDFFFSNLLINRGFHLEMDRILATRLQLAFQDQLDIIQDRRQSLRAGPDAAEGHPLLSGLAASETDSESSRSGDAEGTSRAARDVKAGIQWFAGNLQPVLLLGESGSGRRLAAKQIHLSSVYGDGPYIEADLQKFDPAIWEGKLFGHDKDAFPFSQVRQAGIFEQFRGGTVVLYHAEILPEYIQQKLVAAIRDGVFFRVAGSTPLKFATRLIFVCASEEQPESPACRFIPALKNQLSEWVLEMPPLRSHKRDIPRLAQHYLELFNREYSRNIRSISSGALGMLMNYDWPGNMTELGNVIQRAVLLAEKGEILSEQILLGLPQPEGKQEYNLLRWPLVRRIMESRLFPMLPRLVIAVGFIGGLLALFFGPQDPEQNIGLVMSWAIGWPLLLFSFFFLGRIWCSVCSFSLPGNLIQAIIRPQRSVPELFTKYSGWIMAILGIMVFWVEIVWDAYRDARLTGYIVLAITAGALLFSIFFKRRAWCRYICPLGGLNAIFAMPSVMELRANHHFCLNSCLDHTCYKGGEHEGCPMFRHPFLVDNNRDCILCANCVKNCPHRSIQVNLRVAPQELWRIQSPRAADSFLVMALVAVFFPLARHQQFLALIHRYDWPHLAGTLYLVGLIGLAVGGYSVFILLQSRLAKRNFAPLFAASGYGLIPLVLGAFLAVYFEMFISGAWRFIPLLLSPFNQVMLPADYRFLTKEATVTLQSLIILGGMLAAFYATYRIVKRYTWSEGFILRLFGLPYGFLLVLGILFLVFI